MNTPVRTFCLAVAVSLSRSISLADVPNAYRKVPFRNSQRFWRSASLPLIQRRYRSNKHAKVTKTYWIKKLYLGSKIVVLLNYLRNHSNRIRILLSYSAVAYGTMAKPMTDTTA